MSQYPSNFGQQPGGSSFGGPTYGAPSHGAPGGSPYAGPGGMHQQPAPKKGPNWLLIVGIVVGVLGLGGAAAGVCCCGGGFAMFSFGMQMSADAVKAEVADNPVIQERIGPIESITMNIEKTGQYGGGAENTIAYDISGPNGSGILVVEQSDDIENMQIYSGRLITSDGEEIDLGY